ncbi:helix-turn-helix domain-containing protein [Aliiroseovarius sediminis]|uniref:winged helix-turn-helix transcriptional regulator n=1 Tax=Aliiroseovarius sediminis TaxID=2925839 RepID=UPI001F57AA3A|nr:helix-turn-helix domain-containing protein [Aliiroseovarius sediminis]MCI2395345.1 helix-turn-helix transcriptional regulator [Aliiroseovarius sediminis]
MSRLKPYAMSCPVSLSLDLLGNRWALLVLRELHAGPASFAQIRGGLPGIATNMLSARLTELCNAGLISKTRRLYALTDAGLSTRAILFELARFGRSLPAPDAPSDPDGISHRAVVFAGAIERAAGPLDDIRAQITLNGEPFALTVSGGRVALQAGPMPLAPVELAFEWSDVEAVARGDQRVAHFVAEREIAAEDPLQVAALLDLLQKAMDIYGGFK